MINMKLDGMKYTYNKNLIVSEYTISKILDCCSQIDALSNALVEYFHYSLRDFVNSFKNKNEYLTFKISMNKLCGRIIY